MMKLLGWTPGDYISHFDLIVGRQYARFGEFGLAFDNGYESHPGILIDVGGKSLELSAFLARSEWEKYSAENYSQGVPCPVYQDSLAVGRVSYGFGESRSTVSSRECFARVGFNYLGNGVGVEKGMGADLDTELLSASYINRLRVEYFQMQTAQGGTDVGDTKAWEDYQNSLIAWVDLYNDGNTCISAAYADIGLVPGFSSVDNNPFEEYDVRLDLATRQYAPIRNRLFSEPVDPKKPGDYYPVFYGYESGVNPFPMNFEGFGVRAEHTWWDVLNTRLTFYDGTDQTDGDYPVLIKLNIRYPLSEASDIALEYIHWGLDAPTVAKLRGEFLVRF